jgi:hypothetical protein
MTKPVELSIGIETKDNKLGFDLFATQSLVPGKTEKEITEGISIKFQGEMVCLTVDFPNVIQIAILFGELVGIPIAVGVLSNYIYDKLKNGRASKVVINNQPVEINAEEIKQVIINNYYVVLNKENEENSQN